MATTACCQRGVRQRGMAARAVEQLAAALREWIGRRGYRAITVGCDRKLIVHVRTSAICGEIAISLCAFFFQAGFWSGSAQSQRGFPKNPGGGEE